MGLSATRYSATPLYFALFRHAPLFRAIPPRPFISPRSRISAKKYDNKRPVGHLQYSRHTQKILVVLRKSEHNKRIFKKHPKASKSATPTTAASAVAEGVATPTTTTTAGATASAVAEGVATPTTTTTTTGATASAVASGAAAPAASMATHRTCSKTCDKYRQEAPHPLNQFMVSSPLPPHGIQPCSRSHRIP